MNRNAPLHLLAILAAGVSGFVVPTILLELTWQLVRQGQWLFALGALVALVGYLETLWVALRGTRSTARRWEIKP